MGRARIVSALGDGAYTVELEYKRERVENEIAFLIVRLADLDEQLVIAQGAEVEAMELHENAIASLDAAIAAYVAVLEANSDPESMDDAAISAARAAVTGATVAATETDGARQIAQAATQSLQAQILVLTMRLNQLEAIPENPEKIAYCADYSVALGGTVGTVELPASEGHEVVTIRPDYPGAAAAYDAAADGQLMHRAGMSPEQAYFNAAILPGWQRHMPLYRAGTLTAVDKVANTGSVSLGDTTSSAQSLPVNVSSSLSGVPIQYMECDADPFEEGDRVVVKFTGDWATPIIIGFETNPKPCGDYGTPAAGLAPSMSFFTDTALLKSNGMIVHLPGNCIGGSCTHSWSTTSFKGLGPICAVNRTFNDTDYVVAGDAYFHEESGLWRRPYTRTITESVVITDEEYTATMDHLREISLGGMGFFFKYAQTFGRSGTRTRNWEQYSIWSVKGNARLDRYVEHEWTITEQRTESLAETVSTTMIVNGVDAGVVHTMTSSYAYTRDYYSEGSFSPFHENSHDVTSYERTFNAWDRVYEISNDDVHDPMHRGGYDYTAIGTYTYNLDEWYTPSTKHGWYRPAYPIGTEVSYTHTRSAFGSPVTFVGNVSGIVTATIDEDNLYGRPLKPLTESFLATLTGGPPPGADAWR